MPDHWTATLFVRSCRRRTFGRYRARRTTGWSLAAPIGRSVSVDIRRRTGRDHDAATTGRRFQCGDHAAWSMARGFHRGARRWCGESMAPGTAYSTTRIGPARWPSRPRKNGLPPAAMMARSGCWTSVTAHWKLIGHRDVIAAVGIARSGIWLASASTGCTDRVCRLTTTDHISRAEWWWGRCHYGCWCCW
jgi:hypothetical protein